MKSEQQPATRFNNQIQLPPFLDLVKTTSSPLPPDQSPAKLSPPSAPMLPPFVLSQKRPLSDTGASPSPTFSRIYKTQRSLGPEAASTCHLALAEGPVRSSSAPGISHSHSENLAQTSSFPSFGMSPPAPQQSSFAHQHPSYAPTPPPYHPVAYYLPEDLEMPPDQPLNPLWPSINQSSTSHRQSSTNTVRQQRLFGRMMYTPRSPVPPLSVTRSMACCICGHLTCQCRFSSPPALF